MKTPWPLALLLLLIVLSLALGSEVPGNTQAKSASIDLSRSTELNPVHNAAVPIAPPDPGCTRHDSLGVQETVQSQETASHMPSFPHQTATISGQVTGYSDGNVEGACVSAYRAACSMIPAKHYCCTDESGHYAIRDLPPGTYYLRTHTTCECKTSPHGDEWYTAQGGTTDCMAAEKIILAAGETRGGLDFTLPLRQDPLPAPAPPEPFPTPVAIPLGLRSTYRVEYSVVTEPHWCRLWMPVPQYWDGNGAWQFELGEISPPPSELYWEPNGNLVAYWDLTTQGSITVTEVVTVQMSPQGMTYALDDSMEWPPYDTTSLLYQQNTEPTQWVQSDHPLIVQQARQIAGTETNPYRLARDIHHWVKTEIAGPGSELPDALSVLQTKEGACGGHSNLFVALCRALGIPARNVSGLHSPGQDDLVSGCSQDILGTHVWSEFYLPNYGWVQVDTSSSGYRFPGLPEARLALAKGNSIQLGQQHACSPLSWFQAPQVNHLSGSYVPCQTTGMSLCSRVQKLPPDQVHVPLVVRR